MKKGIFIIPSAITLMGMLCGFYAIIQALQGDFYRAALFIVFAATVDAIDGPVARYTQTTSAFGVELDSLSDFLCFGMAPAMLGYFWATRLIDEPRLGWLITFVFIACGALRLARSNTQSLSTKKSKQFTGLPIPAAAGSIVSTIMVSEHWAKMGVNQPITLFFTHILPLLMLALSFLMVSTIPYHSLKELDFKQRTPFRILFYFVLILIILVLRPELTWFTGFTLYAISGPLELLVHRQWFAASAGQKDRPWSDHTKA